MSVQIFGFQPSGTAGHGAGASVVPPEPHRPAPEPLPEREWGLSAGQVVAVVLAIVAACEVFGLLF